jgi:quercetin dioxygenase-like cupin family protein
MTGLTQLKITLTYMYKTIFTVFSLVLITSLSGCTQKEIGVMDFPDGKVQHVVRYESTQWKPCPPALPEGCEMAMLEGHPKKADLFTVRFHSSQKILLPPHTHPKDERVTIIQGKVAVAFGMDKKREQATEFGPGDYYVNARNAVHTVWIEEGSIVQITGIGPWAVNYVNK